MSEASGLATIAPHVGQGQHVVRRARETCSQYNIKARYPRGEKRRAIIRELAQRVTCLRGKKHLDTGQCTRIQLEVASAEAETLLD